MPDLPPYSQTGHTAAASLPTADWPQVPPPAGYPGPDPSWPVSGPVSGPVGVPMGGPVGVPMGGPAGPVAVQPDLPTQPIAVPPSSYGGASIAYQQIARPAAGQGGSAVAVDIAIYLGALVAALVAATVIAVVRGADGAGAVAGHLSWVHPLLAVLVAGAYWAGSWLFLGRTPGSAVTGRMSASGPTVGRPVGWAFVPILSAVVASAVVAGLLAPVASGSTGTDPGAFRGSVRPTDVGYESGAGSGSDAPVTTAPASVQPSPVVPTAEPRAQAAAIDAVLTSSSASRTKLRDALNAIDQCGDVGTALTRLREVGDERRSQLDQVRSVAVSAIPTGEEIRSTLVEALTYSLQADEAFVTWAINVLDVGCHGHDADYEAGMVASRSAQSAKKRLVALWNPVASGYGLPSRTEASV